MAEVVSLAKFKEENAPHWGGTVKCTACRHQWEHAAPVGVIWVECPKCELMTGHPYYPFGADVGDVLFTCTDCGGEAMTAYYQGQHFRFQCLGCGVDHTSAIFGEAP